MYPAQQSQKFYDAVTPVTVTSSTNATPTVITATAHGLVTGDRVAIYGHATNTAANGIFRATRLSANTFSIQDEFTNADIAANGVGTGGILVKAPPVSLVIGFKTLELQVGTSGTATVSLAVFGSLGKTADTTGPRYDFPNMGATVSPSNPWSLLQIIDLDTGTALNGATGIVVAGTDINKQYEVNINSTKYLTIIPISWTAGVITAKGQFITNS